jgi:hypothetical protein
MIQGRAPANAPAAAFFRLGPEDQRGQDGRRRQQQREGKRPKADPGRQAQTQPAADVALASDDLRRQQHAQAPEEQRFAVSAQGAGRIEGQEHRRDGQQQHGRVRHGGRVEGRPAEPVPQDQRAGE